MFYMHNISQWFFGASLWLFVK